MKAENVKINSFEEKRSWIFAGFIFLLFPFIFNPFLQDQDFLPKNIALCISIIIVGLSLIFDKNPIALSKNAKYFFLLFVVFIISTILSSHKIVNIDEGYSAFFMNILPFLLLFTMLKSKGLIDLNKWAILSCYSIFILFTIVLGQIIFGYITEDDFIINFSIRATLSNKNFISEALILYLPFNFYGIVFGDHKRKKVALIALVLNISLILILQTSSALLALFIPLLLFFPIYQKLYSTSSVLPKIKLKYILPAITLGIVLFFITGSKTRVAGKIQIAQNYISTDFTKIIAEDDSSNMNSVYERFLLWNNSYKLFLENPITGMGLSNWRILYSKYGIGGAYYLNSGVMHFEHPHNELLLLLSESGIISLLAFLSMFGYIILIAWKKRKTETGKINIIFITSILGFLIMALFGYPYHRPLSITLLILIFASVLSTGESKGSKWPVYFALLLSIVFLRFLLIKYSNTEHMANALLLQSKGRFEPMLKELRQIDIKHYSIDGTGTPINWYIGFANFYSGGDSALHYFMEAEKQNPYHVQILSDIGASYENLGNHHKALEYLNRAIAITPRFREARLNCSIAYFNMGELEKALENINVISINPSSENECVILQTIFSKYVIQESNFKQNSVYLQCLNRLTQNNAELLKLNIECSKNNLNFIALLNSHCGNLN
ncbi:MAG: hypothetical protein EYC69_05955 [Bacteroidetes bacterium]|nr:MAG: hypothetical protein EYC69_05955 [Bacteroidota bacterium]